MSRGTSEAGSAEVPSPPPSDVDAVTAHAAHDGRQRATPRHALLGREPARSGFSGSRDVTDTGPPSSGAAPTSIPTPVAASVSTPPRRARRSAVDCDTAALTSSKAASAVTGWPRLREAHAPRNAAPFAADSCSGGAYTCRRDDCRRAELCCDSICGASRQRRFETHTRGAIQE
jgi:hypothetical protein